MSFAVEELWKLLTDSQLFTPEECDQLASRFAAVKGAPQGNAPAAAQWLVSQRVISPYQAKVLLTRRPGPFVFGDYKVYDKIDRGRLAGLFRATHAATRHAVLLKFASGPGLNDPGAVARLGHLSGLAAGLRHPHLARYYHWGDAGSYQFGVLADLHGESLEERLASGRVPLADACRLARQAALGLAELHRFGEVHGEIRPANLWLDRSVALKLLYFPLWRDPLAGPTWPALAGSGSQAPAEQLLATADYVAPEVAAGGWPDARSDLYALGCVLFEMLAGRVPYPGGDVPSKLSRHALQPLEPLETLTTAVPPALAQVVAGLLAKDPALRYQRASALAEALRPFAGNTGAETEERLAPVEAAYEGWLAAHHPPPQPGLPVAPAVPPPPAWSGASSASGTGFPLAAPAVAAGQFTGASGQFPGVSGQFPSVSGQFPSVSGQYPAAPSESAVVSGGMSPPPVGLSLPVAVAVPQPASSGAWPVPVAQPVAQPVVEPDPPVPIVAAERRAAAVPGAAGRVKPRRRLSRQTQNLLITGGVVAVVFGLVFFLLKQPAPEQLAGPASNSANASPAVQPASNPTPPPEQIVTPDAPPAPRETIAALPGQPGVWQSPTAGPPLEARYLPPGVQMLVALRPAQIWQDPARSQAVEALGGLGNLARDELARLTGTPVENIEQALLGFFDNGPGKPPAVALVARLASELDLQAARQAWGTTEPTTIAGQSVYQAGGITRWLPEEGQGKLVAAAPLADPQAAADWLAAAGRPPALRLELELLLASSDAQRHLTLVAAPNFLFAGGKELFAGPGAVLRQPLEALLVDDMGKLPQAALLSIHLDELLFVELRLLDSGGMPAATRAEQLHARLQGLSLTLEDYLAARPISPYSRKILQRYPRMIEELGAHTRAGTADQQVVLRAYLPAIAASNLAFGTRLALVESSGGAAAPAAVAAGPQSVAEKLRQTISLSFPRDNLERTLELIGEEIGVEIQILGGDLETEGITKNQSFGLDERDKPAFEVLRTVMLKANPDNKLVYVIKKEGDKELLCITTRAAAAARGDAIPPELQ